MSREVIGIHTPPTPVCVSTKVDAQLLAVLLRDTNNNSQIAYIGIVHRLSGKAEDYTDMVMAVAGRGSKLTYEEAIKHWPGIKKKDYQR